MSHTSAGLSINSSAKLAVITVVYQNYEILKDFFSGFEKQTNENFHIFISDLSDKKKQITTAILHLTVINGKNLGYSHGINLGIKEAIKAGYTHFIVINSDTYVQENFIKLTLQSLIRHPGSIIGGKIYYAPGFEYHKTRYKATDLGKVIWYSGGSIDWKNVYILHHGVDQIDHQQYDKLTKTDFITGCLVSFDKNIVNKVGYWDEKYFLYFEDADFCERAKRKGIKLYYDPSIIIWHKNAQSTDGSGSVLHQKYQEKNRLRFALKYAPIKAKLFVLKNYIFNPLFNKLQNRSSPFRNY